ncbi:ankyrin repeat domain-containing protein [Pseudoduganella lutea]|nr:ankyrin repeat domain-containing protein [Pseudoduganella lutea]
MTRQPIVLLVLLLGLGALHTAGAHRPLAPKPAASKDPFAWIGPVPKTISTEALHKRWVRLGKQVFDTVSTDVKQFVCKSPAEVGPVPMMDAVERYIDGAPESLYDDEVMSNLNKAAAQGNWLARTLIYFWLRQYSEEELQYRTVMLGEWMYQQRLGQLYAAFGDTLKGSGYYSDAPGIQVTGFDIMAAMRHSYVAQNDVGKALSKSSDPELASVGRKMLACASNSLGAYRRLFSGETDKAKEQRRQAAELATYTPLHRAILDGNVQSVAALLRSAGTDIEARTGNGQTALALALLANPQSRAVVKLLIEHGANAARHGVVDKNASIRKTLLNVAVDATPADPAIIDMLMSAGADPFGLDEVNEYVFQTPFGDSFGLYESGTNPAIFEQFLASRKLDPKGLLAIEYLEHSARYLKVLDRLIAYGVPPEKTEDLVQEMVIQAAMDEGKEDDARRLATLDRLINRYPTLGSQFKGAAGFGNLSQAIYSCKLELATYFLAHGTPVNDSNEMSGGLLGRYLERCDDPGNTDRVQPNEQSRQLFFSALQQRGYDVNKLARDCPVWLSRGGSCEIPRDDDLLSTLLGMGADPFLMYPDQSTSALARSIEQCRPAAFDLMMAKAPKQLAGGALKAVQVALESTKRELWFGLNCPAEFQPRAASQLQALLVK